MKCEIALKLPISDRSPKEEKVLGLAQGDGAEQGPSLAAANSSKLQHTVHGRLCQSSSVLKQRTQEHL